MKKLTLLILTALLSLQCAWSVPANPMLTTLRQPDGTTLTVRLHGDEYLSFLTTADDYTVVQDRQGYYVYARRDAQGQLAPTSVAAHDAAQRDERERTFLQWAPKLLTPPMKPAALREKLAEQSRRQQTLEARKAASFDYSNFRGLIILVEFNDCQFKYSNYNEIMQGMVNQEHYQGTNITNITSYGMNSKCTGSVRDFYRDNSNGVFNPTFDIVGPVQVDRSQYFPKGTDDINTPTLMTEALTAADPLVDFSEFDLDNNGEVDMVYFIFAGEGSHVGSNNRNLLWPHSSQIYEIKYWNNQPYADYVYKDGVRLGRYACSVEMLYNKQYGWLDGIGTICHEFGHVLGLPDFYDADYEGSGGEAHHPGQWSTMSGGNYLNNSRTPAGYSLYERWSLGFAEDPEVIQAEGTYTLDALNTSHKGYMLKTPVNNEYFLLENRQQTGWDAYLPGHGMLVHRVDRTNTRIWNNNQVNNNPSRMYYELLFAGGYRDSGDGLAGTGSDPFPGTYRVRQLTNGSSPANLLSYAGRPCEWNLEGITESGGKITFQTKPNQLQSVTLPSTFTLGVGTKHQLEATREPDYAPYSLSWATADASVAIVDANGMVTGVSEGTTTITVTANGTLSATTQVVVLPLPQVEGLAAFNAQEGSPESQLLLTDAQVVYVYGNDAYVRDASGSTVFSGTGLSLKPGDVLNGSVVLVPSASEGMPLATATDGATSSAGLTITAGDAPQPRELYLDQLSTRDRADLVTLRELTIVRKQLTGSTTNSIVGTYGDHQVVLWNQFQLSGISAPVGNGKLYNITGIMGTRTIGSTVYDAIYMLQSPAETVASGIASAQFCPNCVVTEGSLHLNGYRIGTQFSVSSAAGLTLLSARVDASGSAVVPMQGWSPGVYVLRVGGESYKILKK